MQEFLRLKKSNCRNCYKCIRHCPVKSIRFSGNQAHIVGDECVLCGNCFVICPQNAREIRNDVEKAKVLLASGSPVVASLAPSFSANYAVTDSKLKVDEKKSEIALNLQIDEKICSMYDYFEIFLGRMMLCRKSAEILGTTFKLTVNGRKVL